MSKQPFDEELKKQLRRQTKTAVQEKEAVWNNINNQLFSSSKQRQKQKRIQGWMVGVGSIAIAFVLFVGIFIDSGMEKGQAMFQSLREIFMEEKDVEIEVEGHKEDTNVQLEVNEELRYIIYIDEERYKMVKGEEVDRIETMEPLPERYPEVYMEIFQEANTTTEEVMARLKQDIEKDPEMEVREIKSVSEPIEAQTIRSIGKEHFNWDTPINQYYVTDEIDGRVFVIKQVYFLEAAEGHGARFHHMLKSFEVIK